MASYKAPLTDVKFLLNDVFDYPSHYQSLSNGGEATPDMVDAILGECARFCETPCFRSTRAAIRKAASWWTAK